jgi:glutathione S-transferase
VELYSRDISPFASRVRISILAKGLSIRIIDSPDVQSAEFGKLNPLRRVPVLTLDDGTPLPESETIVEYLEDAFPEVPLRPVDPRQRAQARLISRVAELYVFPACLPIFFARAAGDVDQLNGLFEKLDDAMTRLSTFLDDGSESWHAFGARLTTADGALAPFLFYAQFLGKACDRPILSRHHRLKRFWDGAQTDSVLSTVIEQMATAISAPRPRRSAGSDHAG